MTHDYVWFTYYSEVVCKLVMSYSYVVLKSRGGRLSPVWFAVVACLYAYNVLFVVVEFL